MLAREYTNRELAEEVADSTFNCMLDEICERIEVRIFDVEDGEISESDYESISTLAYELVYNKMRDWK